MNDPRRKNGPYGSLRSAGILLAIPTLLIVAPLVGFFLGGALDRRFKTSPWLGIIGLVLGFAAAARETSQIYRRYLDEEERAKRG